MKKKILIVSIGLVIACLAGIVIILSLIQKQIPIMPSDSELIGEYFNQELPGYSSITVLDQQGTGSGDDPRLLTLRVVMDTGSKPTSCEGRLKFFISDPSYFNYAWNTLECEGQNFLIRMAQRALESELNFACHQEKIASLLTYWVQREKISIDKIANQNLRASVKNSVEENQQVADQIHLLDLSQMTTKDFDPSLPDEQKIVQYVLRCDGSIDQYLAKENITIYSQVTLTDGTYLEPPLDRP